MSLVEAKTYIYTCDDCRTEQIVHSHRDPKLPAGWSTKWTETCQRGCCGITSYYCPSCTKRKAK